MNSNNLHERIHNYTNKETDLEVKTRLWESIDEPLAMKTWTTMRGTIATPIWNHVEIVWNQLYNTIHEYKF